ncbi:hypothetical protein HAX54_011394 [Datura stramonium]|uniref:Uncharacterized protein n=1 Tax=Datura stramonium TaxID=4076 RepID=A0ABS8TKM6_DATST|nr:hypothetical protein [Datura stramonium]
MITDVEMKEPAATETVNNPSAGDGEMMKKKSGIEMIREKFKEWDAWPYQHQFFNKDESLNWCPLVFTVCRNEAGAERMLNSFYDICHSYKSFDFSIEPMIIGELKNYSFSELQAMTNFKRGMEIQETLSGRLFHGTIVEGSVNRPVIVKTWDFLMPLKDEHAHRLYRFCVCSPDRCKSCPRHVWLWGHPLRAPDG